MWPFECCNDGVPQVYMNECNLIPLDRGSHELLRRPCPIEPYMVAVTSAGVACRGQAITQHASAPTIPVLFLQGREALKGRLPGCLVAISLYAGTVQCSSESA